MRNIPSSPLEKTKIARGQIARSQHARIQTPIEQVIQAVLALQGRGQTNCSAIENRRTGLRAGGAERRLQTPTEVLPKAQCWEERAEAAQCARDPCKKIQQWRAEYMLAAALSLQQVFKNNRRLGLSSRVSYISIDLACRVGLCTVRLPGRPTGQTDQAITTEHNCQTTAVPNSVHNPQERARICFH